MAQDECLFDLTAHTEAVYDMTWAPRDTASKEPKILATASFDTSVRLWDASSGDCLRVLSRHIEAVYTVSFNPTGTYLATGSPDHTINIWRVQVGCWMSFLKSLMTFFDTEMNGKALTLYVSVL